jgi:signal-transduction protein with cAMP-binding, CBS, and nucleotidyltransferase domain
MGQSIREVMSTDPIVLQQGASIQEAAQVMRDEDIGDVIVLDDSHQICGIVTDRDIVVRAVAQGREPQSLTVGEICSRDLQTLSPNDDVGDAVKVMSDQAIRRLPVVDKGRPIGIVSLGDLAVTRDPDSVLADISAAPADN